jgi:hypothetical protein
MRFDGLGDLSVSALSKSGFCHEDIPFGILGFRRSIWAITLLTITSMLGASLAGQITRIYAYLGAYALLSRASNSCEFTPTYAV